MVNVTKLLKKLKKMSEKIEQLEKGQPKTQPKPESQPVTENQPLPERLTSTTFEKRDTGTLIPKGKGCKLPSDKSYFQVCQASYKSKKSRPNIINQYWEYLKGNSSDTVAVYIDRMNKVILVGYRGTVVSSVADLLADSRIMFNRLDESPRFQSDQETTTELLKEYPPAEFCYFFTGHSLGNAVQLEMNRKFGNFVQGGRGYNGALQPKDIISPSNKFRYFYIKGDPLYSLSGRLLPKKLLYVFPRVSEKALPNHSLANFEGLTESDAIKRGGSAPEKPPSKSDLIKLGFSSKDEKMIPVAKGIKIPESAFWFYKQLDGGGSTGNYPEVPLKDFAGSFGLTSPFSYPVTSQRQAKSAIRLSGKAPYPDGIRVFVNLKYPDLS